MTEVRPVSAAHRRALLVGAAGFLLFVAGLVTVLATGAEPVTVHSGGYTPLGCAGATGCDDLPGTFGVTGGQLAGSGPAVLGAVLLAGVGSWLWRDATGRPRP
jgi:hypothetical protein